MPAMYAIEGYSDGEWSEFNVSSDGEIHRFDKESEARAVLDELVRVYIPQYSSESECREHLRVVELRDE